MDQTLYVAIIGAGPAGYYTAEAISKDHPEVYVDIIDRLPTPYGLIRAGVAPDHQNIKSVSRRYEGTNKQGNVHFVGNLCLGKDITLQELLELYDAVVLATGAAKDKKLGIKGEDLPGVIGSAAFVGWYNSHPDFTELNPNLKTSAVSIIGNGNVALDVARILAKTEPEMKGSDIAGHAARTIHTNTIKDIYIFGRRGPLEASFTPKELGELNALDQCVALVNPEEIPIDEELPKDLSTLKKKNITILRAMSCNSAESKPVRLHICFYMRPVEIMGHQHVEYLKLEHTKVIDGKTVGTGKFEQIKTGLVIPCVGYRSIPVEGAHYDIKKGCFSNQNGRIDNRLYCVGWASRGPTGTIGTNKPDGVGVAKRILKEIKPAGRKGRTGLDQIIAARRLDIITFRDWKRIEAAEEEAAHNTAPRVKFTNVSDMIQIVHQKEQ